MAHVEPGDAHDEMREQDAGEQPCRQGGNYGLCRTHPTCELVRKMLADMGAELQARREILDAIADAVGEGNCWLKAASIDWRQRLRDFAEDGEEHRLRIKHGDWRRLHATFPGVILYRWGGFYTAYYEDAAELWQQADDTRPMFHCMVQSDPPHRTVIHPLHLNAWVEHLAEICLPVTFVRPDD